MKSAGFTMIELLVVVAVLGILAAIAIPQFNSYRVRSFDSRSVSDLHNAAVAEEAYFSAYEHYVDCATSTICQTSLPAFGVSADVRLSMLRVAAVGNVPEYFIGQSYHPQGTRNDIGTAYRWDSSRGGLQ